TPLTSANPCVIKGNTFAGGTLRDPSYDSNNSVGAVPYPNTANPHYAPANALGRTSRHIQLYDVAYLKIEDNIFDDAEYGIDATDANFSVLKTSSGNGNQFKNLKWGIVIAHTLRSASDVSIIEGNSFNKISGAAVYNTNGKYDVIKKNDF